jgi:hypothetical protein
MNNESSLEMANKIAELIISKSFWGNEWFIFFSLLLVGLVAAACAWAGTYLSTRSQNAAMRADFKKALKNLEKQTNSIKNIEEGIAHDFIEKRELLKIKRTKIEELYLALSEDVDQLSHNMGVATSDMNKDIIMPSNKAEMLARLYFKDELEKEIDYFRQQRGALTTRIRELSEKNLDGQVINVKERVKQNLVYFSNYNQAKINIELALESEMKNLTSRSS